MRSSPSERIEAIAARLTEKPREQLNVEAIMRRLGCHEMAVSLCREHGVTFYDAFVRKVRFRSAARCRHRFWALMRWSTGLSYPEIAGITNSDHTTVLMAIRAHEARLNGERSLDGL